MKTYSRTTCFYCKKQHSVAGAARVAHMRKHVQEGLVREFRLLSGGIYFERVGLLSKPAKREEDA